MLYTFREKASNSSLVRGFSPSKESRVAELEGLDPEDL